ncbi:MAG: hypothetical protein WDZ70_01740 [Candidatus Paceibacterota bacterium]
MHLSEHKHTIAISVTVLVLIGAGFLFLRGGGGGEVLQVETVGGVDGTDSTVISLLGRLRTVEFDEAIFASPGFRNLVDYGVELESQPRGRSNPFAPVGTDAPLEVEVEVDEDEEPEPVEEDQAISTTTPPVEE